MRKILVTPSILNSDFGDLRNVIKNLDSCKVDRIHLDVMDGQFVPNISFGPYVISAIRKATKIPFETHLMIKNPHKYIKQFVEAGSDIVIVHHEAEKDPMESLKLIKKYGARPGIAINPETRFEASKHYLQKVDTFLVMGVPPGFGGQRFIPESLKKIKLARDYIDRHRYGALVSVDGGMNLETSLHAISAGVDELVLGSAIFGSRDIPKRIRLFKRMAILNSR